MKYRQLGRTGWRVSEVGFGAWAIGGDWGTVTESDALEALHASVDEGVNFFDTADVYGDGRSERLIARLVREREEKLYVATKAGRRLQPHSADGYNRANLQAFAERSLKNLGVETLDLLQLHCPPYEVYYRPEVFGALDRLVEEGKIRHYGVSVEKVEEALKATEYPGVQTVQIIFNMLRQRPAELFFELAQKRRVGILARVPLASGLLSGKMRLDTQFPADDHRNYNRQGQAFDIGETFSGIPFEEGLSAVDELRATVPEDSTMAQFALSWILCFDAVSSVIPSAKNVRQARENAAASDLSRPNREAMERVRSVYLERVKPLVHHLW